MKKFSLHWCALLLLAVSMASPTFAQSNSKEWNDLVQKAKGQPLVLGVHALEGHADVIKEFQKKFPDIKVQYSEMSMSTLGPRVVTEQRNGIYAWDVAWGATQSLLTVVLPAGGLEPITDYLVLPEVKDFSNWELGEKYLYASEKGPYIFIHSMQAAASIYGNTDVLKDFKITRPEQLLDPRLKGKMSVRDATRQGNGAFALAGLLQDNGVELVRKLLTEQDLLTIENPRQVTDTIIRGSVAVVIGGYPDVIYECRQQGACKNVIDLPIGGEYVLARGVAVFKNAPHKESTKVFLNWLLSKEGQEVFVREWAKKNGVGASSLRKDVKPDPKHLESVVDYKRVKDYLILGADIGDPYIQQVVKIATELKSK